MSPPLQYRPVAAPGSRFRPTRGYARDARHQNCRCSPVSAQSRREHPRVYERLASLNCFTTKREKPAKTYLAILALFSLLCLPLLNLKLQPHPVIGQLNVLRQGRISSFMPQIVANMGKECPLRL